MNLMRWVGVGCCLALLALTGTATRADAPWELYHLDARQFRDRESVRGVLTVGGDLAQTQTLTAFVGPDRTDTQPAVRWEPVSNFDYHPSIEPDYVFGARFPILGRSGDYLAIAPLPGSYGFWYRVADLERLFPGAVAAATWFDRIDTSGDVGVDIFYFTRDSQRKLYERPAPDAPSRVLTGNPDWFPMVFWITGQAGDYVQISEYLLDEDRFRPLGWVRIHDDEGRLMIWIACEDLC